jgi:hypothetical protein
MSRTVARALVTIGGIGCLSVVVVALYFLNEMNVTYVIFGNLIFMIPCLLLFLFFFCFLFIGLLQLKKSSN